jgi:uncharacterized protein YjbI with pentapeptide repeats
MVVPALAPVRPRAVSPRTGDALLIEDELRELFDRQAVGIVEITGWAGSGKTTTLQHLAAVFEEKRALFLDEPSPEQFVSSKTVPWTVFSAAQGGWRTAVTATYALAPWSEDECIEYLLAVHKERCRAVMSRLRSSDGVALLQGNPQLLRLALDSLARDESLGSISSALLCALDELAVDGRSPAALEQGSIGALLGASSWQATMAEWRERTPASVMAIVRHRPMQLALAVRKVMRMLEAGVCPQVLGSRCPRDLVIGVAAETGRLPNVIQLLRKQLSGDPARHAMAASILHAAGANWQPPGGHLDLQGAYLPGVAWSGLSMPETVLAGADLSGANLREINLAECQADHANLSGADLSDAELYRFNADSANFAGAKLANAHMRYCLLTKANLDRANLHGADLRNVWLVGASLTDACLRGANLWKANLSDALIDGADFARANLEKATLSGVNLHTAGFTNARFKRANLQNCNLEGMQLARADFRRADLRSALLTGSSMPNARFDRACLAGAGLAEIDWEGACLRGADLRGASFHLGSSRCGLVGSPIACEGSRTGFYTDDFTEQDFKAPEEIRKANLCGADLRGARIDDVDFYLVDVRGAIYNRKQEDHLRRCGAILKTRRAK